MSATPSAWKEVLPLNYTVSKLERKTSFQLMTPASWQGDVSNSVTSCHLNEGEDSNHRKLANGFTVRLPWPLGIRRPWFNVIPCQYSPGYHIADCMFKWSWRRNEPQPKRLQSLFPYRANAKAYIYLLNRLQCNRWRPERLEPSPA